jgi:hypothetical protein
LSNAEIQKSFLKYVKKFGEESNFWVLIEYSSVNRLYFIDLNAYYHDFVINYDCEEIDNLFEDLTLEE